MEAIKAYYNGSAFVPVAPVKVKLNQPALITIIEDENSRLSSNSYVEFFGALSAESCLEIIETLKDTEKVDIDGW